MIAFSSADDLVRYDLGPPGDGWLRSALGTGGTLGALLSEHLDFMSGIAFTFLPPETDSERIRRWEEGGLISGTAALDRLVQVLQLMLRRPHRYLVVANAVARPLDPVLRTLEGERFMVSEEVYEFVGPASSSEEIRACLRRADAGYSLNAVVTLLPRAPRRFEDPDFLQEAIDQPEIVVVRAYDGEGFVVWERSR